MSVQGIREWTLQAARREIDRAEDIKGKEKMRGKSTEQEPFRAGASWGVVALRYARARHGGFFCTHRPREGMNTTHGCVMGFGPINTIKR